MTTHFTNETGFTLLELLIVVFILGAIALSTVSFTNTADSQFRYENTQRRLESIRRAIVGDAEPTFQGQRMLSGYVVDNGVLATTLTSLTDQPVGFDTFNSQTPQFDPDPASDGFNNNPTSNWIPINQTLFKGYQGSYLSLTPGITREYRDGWGNGASGDVNYGWTITSTTSFKTESAGANGQFNPSDSGYDQDISDEVQILDWTKDVNGWGVKVTNSTGSDIAFPTGGGCFRVSMLTYVNDNDPVKQWIRLTSQCIDGGDGNPSNGSCLDGDGDGLVNSVSCTSFANATFPSTLPVSTIIPIGQHVLFLVEDDNLTPHDGSAGEKPDITVLTPDRQIIKRVNFFPRAVLPDIELVIK